MTAPGPMGGYYLSDLCPCRCHRVGNPEDVMCGCDDDCGEGLDDE